jgi:hypothetical protein
MLRGNPANLPGSQSPSNPRFRRTTHSQNRKGETWALNAHARQLVRVFSKTRPRADRSSLRPASRTGHLHQLTRPRQLLGPCTGDDLHWSRPPSGVPRSLLWRKYYRHQLSWSNRRRCPEAGNRAPHGVQHRSPCRLRYYSCCRTLRYRLYPCWRFRPRMDRREGGAPRDDLCPGRRDRAQNRGKTRGRGDHGPLQARRPGLAVQGPSWADRGPGRSGKAAVAERSARAPSAPELWRGSGEPDDAADREGLLDHGEVPQALLTPEF